jgi:hypothetical protein
MDFSPPLLAVLICPVLADPGTAVNLTTHPEDSRELCTLSVLSKVLPRNGPSRLCALLLWRGIVRVCCHRSRFPCS